MKKTAKTIAMILVVVMLVGSFTSCFTMMAISNGDPGWLILTIPLDIITFPIQLIGLAIGFPFSDFVFLNMESELYLANAESIPETERAAAIEKYTSLSETRRAALVNAYASVPEEEIVSSLKRINAFTETERISLLRTFNSLSEAELDYLIEEIRR